MSRDDKAIVAILGGGAAGCLLARELVDKGLGARYDIHIFEQKKTPERSGRWCLWEVDDHTHPFPGLVSHRWHQMRFTRDTQKYNGADTDLDITGCPYAQIKWDDFYTHVYEWLQARDSIHIHTGMTPSLHGTDTAPLVRHGGRDYECAYVFDSRPPSRAPGFVQHFTGWVVETEKPCFEPDRATLMDFRGMPDEAIRFFYILPYSAHRALVEVTYLTPSVMEDRVYETALRSWLDTRLEGQDYEVMETESGAIPLYTRKPAHPRGAIIPIGTRAGMVRASTGYGFIHMIDHARHIARRLEAGRDPAGAGDPYPPFTRWMDRVFVNVLQDHPSRAPDIFAAMFNRLEGEAIARFLMGRGCARDIARVIIAMPKFIFMKAAIKRG